MNASSQQSSFLKVITIYHELQFILPYVTYIILSCTAQSDVKYKNKMKYLLFLAIFHSLCPLQCFPPTVLIFIDSMGFKIGRAHV